METRRLGTTDMSITKVGVGAWAIGGGGWAAGWGRQDDDESVAAIRHAIALGVNWIDTAPAYGLGHSEEVVARALRDLPADERPYVFTKCGLIRVDPFDPPNRTGDPGTIRREVDESLRRLRVERLDLLQVHWPAEDGVPIEEYWGTLAELKQAGKARAIGLSNHTVEQLERAEAVAHVDTLQPPFSMINRAAAADLLPWCSAHSTGVIVYSPMQSGLLTGRFDAERVRNLDPEDWRTRNPEFTTHLEANLALVERLRAVADRLGTTLPAVAIGWVLSSDAVTGAIVGARNPGQVDGWLPGATIQLDEATLDELAEAIAQTGAGRGPSRP